MTKLRFSFLFILFSAFFSGHVKAQQACQGLFVDSVLPIKTDKELLNEDLLSLQRSEVIGKSSDEIEKINLQSINKLDVSVANEGSPSGKRRDEISRSDMSQVLQSISRHPVVSSLQKSRYAQENVDIGFCFGRATYVHLALLKMGVNKNSIRKIWAVGPMKTGNINWQFHVATIVKGVDQKWYAIDSSFGGPLEVHEWYDFFKGFNEEGNLRIYITDPSKFSVNLGTYDRIQMGLNLTKDQDWYRGYFQDLMQWFRTGNLQAVGLKPL